MPTYVSLVRMTEGGLKSVGDFGSMWEEGRKRAEAMGIKHVAAYGVLGPYDMMFIYEAPNEKAAASMPLSFAPRELGTPLPGHLFRWMNLRRWRANLRAKHTL